MPRSDEPHGRVTPPRRDVLDVQLARVLYEDQAMSLRSIANQLATTPDIVRLRLVRSGVTLRPPGRGRQHADSLDASELTNAYVTRQLSIEGIAEELGCSVNHVREELRRHGIKRRRVPAPLPEGWVALTPEVLHDLYARDELTIAEIATRVGGSAARVQAALRKAGIPARPPGTVPTRRLQPLTKELLHRLYVVEQLSAAKIAERVGGDPSRVLNALERAGIPRRPRNVPRPELTIGDPDLFELYVNERVSAEDIAAAHGVSTWQVRVRLRADGIKRPSGSPPRPPNSPPRRVLARRYIRQGRTIAQIAAEYRTSKPKVRAWLSNTGIPIAPRTSRSHRLQLPVDEVTDSYWEQDRSAADITSEYGTTVNQVLRCLHDGGKPVRLGFGRDGSLRVLDLLYADKQIRALLERHGIPAVDRPGTIAERFPTAFGLSDSLLAELYDGLGLSARHIELLTGQPHEQILDRLHGLGLEVRPIGSFSPWRQKQIEERR